MCFIKYILSFSVLQTNHVYDDDENCQPLTSTKHKNSIIMWNAAFDSLVKYKGLSLFEIFDTGYYMMNKYWETFET